MQQNKPEILSVVFKYYCFSLMFFLIVANNLCVKIYFIIVYWINNSSKVSTVEYYFST